MGKKKVLLDVLLNLVATTVPTLLLQFLLLPQMAARMDGEEYGLLVTMAALMAIVPSTMGNVLNNIRLLRRDACPKKEQHGDFCILLGGLSAVNLVIMTVMTARYEGGLHPKSMALTLALSLLWLLWDYSIVEFRLEIDYWAYLKCCLVKSIGFVAGYLLFRAEGSWQLVYMTGYALSDAYIILKSGAWRLPVRRSPRLREISKDTFLLLGAKILQRAVGYADKLLIYPLMGGAVASVYYVATVFGKAVSLVIAPMNSVALTYLSRFKRKDDALFYRAIGIGALFCALGYAMSVLVGRPVLRLLYPQYADAAVKLLWITSAIVVVQTLNSIADPFVLKFAPLKWQVLVNGSTVLVYVALGIVLLRGFGIAGFCAGVLMANVLKFLIMLGIYRNAGSDMQ